MSGKLEACGVKWEGGEGGEGWKILCVRFQMLNLILWAPKFLKDHKFTSSLLGCRSLICLCLNWKCGQHNASIICQYIKMPSKGKPSLIFTRVFCCIQVFCLGFGLLMCTIVNVVDAPKGETKVDIYQSFSVAFKFYTWVLDWWCVQLSMYAFIWCWAGWNGES